MLSGSGQDLDKVGSRAGGLGVREGPGPGLARCHREPRAPAKSLAQQPLPRAVGAAKTVASLAQPPGDKVHAAC